MLSPLRFAVLGIAALPALAQEGVLSFNSDIRPILSDKCFKCHGPDAENQESEFRLDTAEHAMADLGGYFGIQPGDTDASELVKRIFSEAESEMMPPVDSNLSLTEEEKQKLVQWIEEGAVYEKHWSLELLSDAVPVPSSRGDWARNDIDRFIEAGFAVREVGPAAEANREKWLRRVTFDLTGLPPSEADIEAFLADDSVRAFERVVNRLLDSLAYAERMTTEWLDVARYSDSYGYQRDDIRLVWPWRDWVISAFAENMPYDEFVTLQLAGDLLPDAGQEETLPTAFNRLHGHVKEGGIVLEEYRVEYVADRTHTFGTAFLGLTFECARCHDHKYDPITMKDYYSLSSFFANIDESGLISYFTDAAPTPAMPLSNPEADAAMALAREVEAVVLGERKTLEEGMASTDEFREWLQYHRPAGGDLPGLAGHLSFDVWEDGGKLSNSVDVTNPALTGERNRLVPGRFGQAIEFDGDEVTHLPNVGHYQREDAFSYSLWLWQNETAPRENVYSRGAGADDAASIGYEFLLIDGKPTASLIHFWPGNGLRVQALEPLAPREWHHLVVTYDGSSRAAGLKLYLNGEPLATRVVQDRLTRSISEWIKISEQESHRHHLVLGQRYRDRGFVKGRLDEFRAFDRELTAIEARQLFDGKSLDLLLAKDATALSDAQLVALADYFAATTSNAVREVRADLLAARADWNRTMDALPAISIMQETDEPKPAYILTRGAYDQRAEQVTAATPESLPAFPADAPRNRLGLAQWLLEPNHPLTARVVVNRYWQMMFGQGLVRTPEDFGSQGRPPTHPLLLDWLARDFVNSGWDIHHLLRQMALSATYRQSTVISPATRLRDPENVTWCRSEPKRLEAEMIRDNALAVSGLLVGTVGGPPVKPYELAVAFEPVEPDEGDSLYRRSLYTRSKRNSPAPVMIAFDAP